MMEIEKRVKKEICDKTATQVILGQLILKCKKNYASLAFTFNRLSSIVMIAIVFLKTIFIILCRKVKN